MYSWTRLSEACWRANAVDSASCQFRGALRRGKNVQDEKQETRNNFAFDLTSQHPQWTGPAVAAAVAVADTRCTGAAAAVDGD